MSPADADWQASVDDGQPLQSWFSEAQDILEIVSTIDGSSMVFV
jgi:hypothetical protein